MRYTCEGHEPVEACDMHEAGALFAAQMARASYGADGRVRACHAESFARDGSHAEFSAFIGRPRAQGDGWLAGENVRFVVFAAKEMPVAEE